MLQTVHDVVGRRCSIPIPLCYCASLAATQEAVGNVLVGAWRIRSLEEKSAKQTARTLRDGTLQTTADLVSGRSDKDGRKVSGRLRVVKKRPPRCQRRAARCSVLSTVTVSRGRLAWQNSRKKKILISEASLVVTLRLRREGHDLTKEAHRERAQSRGRMPVDHSSRCSAEHRRGQRCSFKNKRPRNLSQAARWHGPSRPTQQHQVLCLQKHQNRSW